MTNQTNNQNWITPLLEKAQEKLKANTGKLGAVHPRLTLMIRMMRDVLKGRFKLPAKTILSLIGGIIYFVNPADVIPDVIFGLGYVDDMAVIQWIYSHLKSDFKRYEETVKNKN